MDESKLTTYGYELGKSIQVGVPGEHSVFYEAIKSFDPEKKNEPGVLGKVLYMQGKSRHISHYSNNREEFLVEVVDPMNKKLKLADKFFGEFLPPYYLEVDSGEGFDVSGNLEIPAKFYTYRVQEKSNLSEVDWQEYEEGLVLFFKKSIEFLDFQEQEKKQLTDPNKFEGYYLPDIKITNFVFGKHMGDNTDRLYFVDLHPVFLTAGRVIQNLKIADLARKFTSLGEEQEALYTKWKSLDKDTHDWDSF